MGNKMAFVVVWVTYQSAQDRLPRVWNDNLEMLANATTLETADTRLMEILYSMSLLITIELDVYWQNICNPILYKTLPYFLNTLYI